MDTLTKTFTMAAELLHESACELGLPGFPALEDRTGVQYLYACSAISAATNEGRAPWSERSRSAFRFARAALAFLYFEDSGAKDEDDVWFGSAHSASAGRLARRYEHRIFALLFAAEFYRLEDEEPKRRPAAKAKAKRRKVARASRV